MYLKSCTLQPSKPLFMKQLFIVALLATPLFWSCEKQAPCSKPVKSSASTKVLHCSPWRDVYGVSALCTELNGFENCNTSACTGSSVVTSLSNTSLDDPSGNDYLVSLDQLVTASEQSQMMSQASIWANAHVPAGYFVSAISFQPSPGLSSGTQITITVTYRKCTGGGGGGAG